MEKLFIGALGLALLATACNNNPKGDKAGTSDAATEMSANMGESLPIDVASSSVTWTGSKVTGNHHGTIALQSGNLMIDSGKLVGGEFIIDMTSMANKDMETDTENKEKLEGHLKSDDFFAVEKYPTSKFVITQVDYKEANKAEISGNLTLKDVTKNIKFNADLMMDSPEEVSAKADFNINRKDWGIVYTGMKDDLIADEINLKVDLLAKK